MKYLLNALFTLFLLTGCSETDTSSDTKKSRPLPKVSVTTVKTERIAPTVERLGTIFPRHQVTITAEEEGKVVRLPFYAGDRVAKGELLFALATTLLEAELKKAGATRRQAELDLARVERLLSNRMIAEEEIARARTAVDVAQAEEDLLRIRLRRSSAYAPFDGIVSERLVEPGDIVAQHAPLMTLYDPEELLVKLEVSERFLTTLGIGDTVSLRLDADPDKRIGATITRIHPTVDPVTRLGIVEIRLPVMQPPLRPGQLARVRLEGRPAPYLLIPIAALRRDNRGEFVFRVNAADELERAAITSGDAVHGERLVVRDGLNEGDQIVVSGFIGLTDGAKVEVTPAQ